MRNPARLLTTHCSSSSNSSPANASPSQDKETTPYFSPDTMSPVLHHSTPNRVDTDSSTFTAASATSTETSDSLWSTSLSRYTFCSSSISNQSGSPASQCRSCGRRKRTKRTKSRKSDTTMRSGRHGDEWLFAGWGNVVKGMWR